MCATLAGKWRFHGWTRSLFSRGRIKYNEIIGFIALFGISVGVAELHG